jgi:hypothetical protein
MYRNATDIPVTNSNRKVLRKRNAPDETATEVLSLK